MNTICYKSSGLYAGYNYNTLSFKYSNIIQAEQLQLQFVIKLHTFILNPYLLTCYFEKLVLWLITIHIQQEGSGKPGWLQIKWCISALVYADGLNILGRRVRTINKNTDTLVAASQETGKEGNADKTKYMVMPQKKRMQDKVTISRLIIVPLKGCKQFKYLGTTLTNQNSIQEEI